MLVKMNRGVVTNLVKYIFSKDELQSANYEQKKFYQIYKDSFLKDKMIDVEGNDNYTFVLFYDLMH
jgi:hypothetical protein